MAESLAEALSRLISSEGGYSGLKASFMILGRTFPEIHLMMDGYDQTYTLENRVVEGYEAKLVKSDSEIFERDVDKGVLMEILAGRLLLPIKPVYGSDYVRKLELRYKMNAVKQLVKDLVSEHKIAVLELRISPEFFLYEKVRRLSAIFPHMQRDFAELYAAGWLEKVMPGFLQALHRLVSEGLLEHADGYFKVSESAYREYSRLPSLVPSRLSHQLKEYISRPLLTKVVLQHFLDTAGQMVRPPPPTESSLPDPESFISINTRMGLQPLTFQLEVGELVKHLYGDKPVEIRRKGGLLNSTYVLTVKDDGLRRLFIKKYLNWTDLKWLAARVWTAWVKNFSINPSTRLATEIFFLDQLRNMGFNTPEVVHVNWRRKILFTTYLDGENLLEVWLREDEGRREIAKMVGSCLARIHSKGVRLGDCKPESFMRVQGDIYLTDLEQASFSGDSSWDLMELIFYPGHYLSAEEASSLAVHVVEGYLSLGDPDVVSGVLKSSHLRIISPWTPIWVQRVIGDSVRRYLRA
ncbi:MAG: lipopolysaccharide kinase InaA family protein [Nitrososphaerota archaeon]